MPKSIAEQITDYLFTNGANRKARRLVFEMEDGSDGGGWGREPARDAIQAHLDKLGAASLGEKLPTTEELDNLDDDDFSGRRVCPLNLTIAEVRALRELLEALAGKENRRDDNA